MQIALDLNNFCEIAERMPLVCETGEPGYSGARFERIVLSDGRRLVVKRLPPEGDWLTRVTGGAGRTRLLWDSGTLGEVGAIVDHGIMAVVRSEGADVVVMRDLTESLLPLEGRWRPSMYVACSVAWRPCTGTGSIVTSRACVRPRLAIARTPPRFRPATPGPTPIRIGS